MYIFLFCKVGITKQMNSIKTDFNSNHISLIIIYLIRFISLLIKTSINSTENRDVW